MKTVAIFIFLALPIFIIPKTTLAAENCEAELRNVHWGMTREQVKKVETAEVFRDEKYLMYEIDAYGSRCGLSYAFGENGLESVHFNFFPDSPETAKALLQTITTDLGSKHTLEDVPYYVVLKKGQILYIYNTPCAEIRISGTVGQTSLIILTYKELNKALKDNRVREEKFKLTQQEKSS